MADIDGGGHTVGSDKLDLSCIAQGALISIGSPSGQRRFFIKFGGGVNDHIPVIELTEVNRSKFISGYMPDVTRLRLSEATDLQLH